MKYLLLAALVICTSTVHAEEDQWTGSDKAKHFAVSSIIGFGAYAYSKNKLKAFGIALAPGVLKEISDSQKANNHFSGKDLAWDALGAYAGVQTGDWVINSQGIAWGKRW